jgi:hypothetical protein
MLGFDDLYFFAVFNSGDLIIAEDLGKVYSTYGGEEYTEFWCGNLNKMGQLEPKDY